MDLAQRLRAVMRLDPSARAFEYKDEWSSWGDVDAAVRSLDDLLAGHDIGAGGCVGILPRTRAGSVAAFVGILATNRCAVFVSPMQSDALIGKDLASVGCDAVLAAAEDWERPGLLAAASDAGVHAIVIPDNVGPALMLQAADSNRSPTIRAGVAIEMLTSGTTGPAKRIDLKYGALSASLVGAGVYEGRMGPEPPRLRNSAVITWNPLVHASGVFDVLAAVHDGRRLALLERFEPRAWAELIQRHEAKVTGMTPTAVRMVLDADISYEQLESLVAIICGSARLEVDLHREWNETYPQIPILEVYGATEFAGGVAGWTLAEYHEYMPAKLGAQGRAQPGVEMRIVDPSDGAVLDNDALGLLEIRSVQTGGTEWLRTNDLARIDADGFLWVEGRADDIIVRGGFKIAPGKVKAALELHPAVFEALVVGLPDARLGEVPVAVVEVLAGADAPSETELLELARAQLSRYEMPVQIKVMRELPRTPSTKVSRPEVKRLFTEAML